VSARAWTAFGIVSVLWGIPYLLIKVAVDDGIPPAFLAWARCLIGAAVLLPLAWRGGGLRGLWQRKWVLLAFTLVEIVVPWPLLAAGEQRVDSSLAAILVATVPLLVALIAMRVDAGERPTGARLVGMVIGFGGVVALLGVDVAGQPREVVGALLVLLVAVCYASGPMIVKLRLPDADPVGTVAAALALATIVLSPAAAIAPPESTPGTDAILAVVALGLLCSALAFVFFFVLIKEAGPSRASIITYVNPVVAVALGVALLGEDVGAGAVAGLLLILAGSWLATGGRPPGARRREAARRQAAVAAAGGP
jgi:drug/metabolite transporter (DMT)-like permease